jgi:hypothetical protein
MGVRTDSRLPPAYGCVSTPGLPARARAIRGIPDADHCPSVCRRVRHRCGKSQSSGRLQLVLLRNARGRAGCWQHSDRSSPAARARGCLLSSRRESQFSAPSRPSISVTTCGYQRTSSPVTALPMIRRWISEVPSKIVKIVDYGAVSAGQRPMMARGISTDPARAVQWRLLGRGPRRHRWPTPPKVHPCADLSVLVLQKGRGASTARPGKAARDGPHAGRMCRRGFHAPDGRRRADTSAPRGRQAMTRPARPIPSSWCCRYEQHMGGCQNHFRNSPGQCLSTLVLAALILCGPSGTYSGSSVTARRAVVVGWLRLTLPR